MYNATLAVLHDLPSSRVGRRPWNQVDRRDIIDPFTRSRQALWVTVAGRNGFEPIAVLHGPPSKNGARDDEDKSPNLTNRGFTPEYWPGWAYAFSLILSLCGTFCLLMLFARPHGRRFFAIFSSEPDYYDSELEYDPLPRAFYLSAIGMSLLSLASMWLVVPGVVVQWNVPEKFRPSIEIFSGLLFALGALFVIVLSLLANRSRSGAGVSPSVVPGTHAARAKAAAAAAFLFLAIPRLFRIPDMGASDAVPHLYLFFMAGCFCIGATLIASVLPLWKAIRVEDFLAAYRSLDLTNGVSPLVPATLLFAAFVLFSVVHLKRMAYFEERRPELPKMEGDPFCPKLHKLADVINIRIHEFRNHPLYWAAFVVLAAFFLVGISGPSQTLERRPIEVLIIWAAIAVGFFIALVWIRLVLVWSAFSEFLQQLERHPVRRVFSLLPRGFMWSPVWQGGGKKRTHVAITRSLECMCALVNHPRTPSELRETIKAELRREGTDSLRSNINELLSKSADRLKLPSLKYRQVQRSIANVAQAAVTLLSNDKWGWGLRTEIRVRGQGGNKRGVSHATAGVRV